MPKESLWERRVEVVRALIRQPVQRGLSYWRSKDCRSGIEDNGFRIDYLA